MYFATLQFLSLPNTLFLCPYVALLEISWVRKP